MRQMPQARSPWSLFLPVTLAVFVGALAALAVAQGLWGEAEPTPAVTGPAQGQPPASSPAVQPPIAQEDVPLAAPPAAPVDAPVEVAPVPVPAASDASQVRADEAMSEAPARLQLPGPLHARQSGAPAACVNGTVANRIAGGWEQALEGDAPVRCEVVGD